MIILSCFTINKLLTTAPTASTCNRRAGKIEAIKLQAFVSLAVLSGFGTQSFREFWLGLGLVGSDTLDLGRFEFRDSG